MAEEKITRKLTTILAADVEGYTRLMRADEEATLKTLGEYRQIIDGLIARHDGRVFSTGGDSVLAEFGSAVEAVRCAISCQEEISSRNAELADDRKLMFRIGINVGDVMVRDGDLFGDGVNVAARLEGLAEAGGVCISGSVFEQIKHKLSLGFEDMGQQEVKNIAEPVSAFRLVPGQVSVSVGATAATKPSDGKRWRMPAIAVVVAVLVSIVGGTIWWQPWVERVEPASVERMAFPLPTKPSIVVLPFNNLTGDKAQDHLADGLSENIISTLATMPNLFVIARNSSFTYKGKAVKVKKVAEDLGVGFVLEGSVQRSGDTVRVTAQLIDAIRGYHIWTKRYDRKLTNLFALQDEISGQIATALEVKLTEGEQARLRRKSTSKPEAYRLYLEGKAKFRLFTPRDMKSAENLFEQALAVDPKFVAAIVELAHVHYVYGRVPWSDDPTASFREAEALVRQALAIDANYPEAFTSLGRIERSWRRDFEKALTYHRKAVALSPNCAECLRELANELQYIGDGASAIPIFKQAMRLEPNYSILYLAGLGQSYNLTGEYPKAVQASKEMIKRWPNSYWGYLNIAITYGMMGQTDDARRYVKEALQRRASLRASLYVKYTPYKDRARAEREAAILRKAGMPD